MCGVIGSFGENVEGFLDNLAHRGPDARGAIRVGDLSLGHTRLAIVDPDPRSDQPFRYGGTWLSYNGELWNFREVRQELEDRGRTFRTEGDTEVVAAALNEWDEEALPRLNGMFAMAWTVDGRTVRLARDRYGEIPLSYGLQAPLRFASERKALLAMGVHPRAIRDVGPGCVVTASSSSASSRIWYEIPDDRLPDSFAEASGMVRRLVGNGTAERTLADVPVCTLLSGGVDSSAIAACLVRSIPDLVAFTAVFNERSRDTRMARDVADALGIRLVEVRVPVPSADDLAAVVREIEMPWKAQVEIAWPCLWLADAIRVEGFKVTFSGEGSDELWASYGFSFHELRKERWLGDRGWRDYRKRLFASQARKNFPRCNKVFMARSVECRLPFLHPPLVEYAIGLSREAVEGSDGRVKAVLSNAFEGMVPGEVLTRPKVAFQDGMGIKRSIAGVINDPSRFYNAEYIRAYG